MDQRNKAVVILFFIVVGAVILRNSIRQRYESYWKTFTSTEGNFTVVMPGTPKAESQSLLINGVKLEVHSFKVLFGVNEMFSVSYFDRPLVQMPAAGDRLLDELGQHVTRGDERILSADKLTVNGYPARQYKAIAKDGMQTDEMVCLVRRRLYMLVVVQEGDGKNDIEVNRFFRSFTFQPRE